jgi:2-dehydro-3-deoxyphosphooctonate aldolase (KDO 8-P synthase)
MTRKVEIGGASCGGGGPMLVIAGPCVLESEAVALETARELKDICGRLGLPFVFKSSYDKANRTSYDSFRGPGLKKGLKTLFDIKSSLGVPVISDVHEVRHVEYAADALDALQIPAFLSRQTDLLNAAALTGKPVNVKKGQFLSPWDMKNVVEKFEAAGSEKLLLTERGTSLGYNNLVVDFRSFPVMREFGYPVIFDVTHSLQLPGGAGTASGGQREFAGMMMRAAAAAGVDGLFFETHPDPDKALCDGPNMIPLAKVEEMLKAAKAVSEASQ